LEAALADTQTKAQAAVMQSQMALAREVEAHGETRARLAYRESARGWLRFPFAAVRQRMAERR
jgi:hypothetical protein